MTARGSLTWSLCVATLDRVDVLERCVGLALAQSRPPREIVIADASADWEGHRDRIAALVPPDGPPLRYLKPDRASSASQRNLAIRAATGDVLFLLDDDALMYPDCAETILAIYEGPGGAAVAALGAVNVPAPPDGTAVAAERKEKGGGASGPGLAGRLRDSAAGRWLFREVLMMSAARNFVAYDDRPLLPSAPAPASLPADVRSASVLPGYSMTVRREVAQAEPFEDALLAYCPGEDLDASYRFGRHGLVAVARSARLHHFEAAAGRIKRRKATALALLNVAYVTRRHSARPRAHVAAWYVMALRRTLAEALKDTLSRRWAYPQLRGALLALRHSARVFRIPEAELAPWYDALQRRILAS